MPSPRDITVIGVILFDCVIFFNATLNDIPKSYLFFLKNKIVNLDKIKKITRQKKKDIK